MNQKLTTTLIILSSFLLSACVLRPQAPEKILDSIAEDETPTPPATEEFIITESTEIDVLENELNAVDILEEDFSDIN